ncbi:MAG TPA: YdiU family protein [Burkholderiaceae bacterium]
MPAHPSPPIANPASPEPGIPGLAWHNGFAALGPAFHTRLVPTPLPAPYWVGTSASVTDLLSLDSIWFASQEALDTFIGNRVPEGAQPLAGVYSGHQFGVWAGQLGDGRAILLGETAQGLEVQLKGSGRTPYSRMGDGRAVLRSSIREFLASEAMHALGIPTTRALCVTGSDTPVRREQVETAAVVARVAASFIRFGHFEHFSAAGRMDELRTLADYVIDRYYPGCRAGEGFGGNAYAALLGAVCERTAALMAQWQAVGFCHGVMNTDNMSILGLTIDYGPFQFMDGFDPGHICNHSDTAGRYAFNEQPDAAQWNLFCLAQALLPLIGAQDLAMGTLRKCYRARFPLEYQARMRAKLGLRDEQQGDAALVEATLQLLAREHTDYTIFWHRLSHGVASGNLEPVRDLFLDRAAFDAWALSFQERTALVDQALAVDLMLKTNPKYVLRNHLAETAIARAREHDFTELATLQRLLETPYSEHPGFEDYASFPPEWASTIEISCSS